MNIFYVLFTWLFGAALFVYFVAIVCTMTSRRTRRYHRRR